MVLIERCRTCKNNWDGHCIVGNDIWKMKNSNKEVECEEYKKNTRTRKAIMGKDERIINWETLKPRKSELQKYKEAYEDDPLFKIKPLPLGKTNSSQIHDVLPDW